jgi:predicted enzyme related to lactoylglutathione lyase
MRAKWEGDASSSRVGVFAPARGGSARPLGERLFLWPELRARDVDRAQRFYAAVLDCAVTVLPGEATIVLRREEGPIAAIGELPDGERAEARSPSATSATSDRWRLYVVRRTPASAAGARLVGRAFLEDARGARLAAAQAAAQFGAADTGGEAVLWTDLGASDEPGALGEALGAAVVLEAAASARVAMDDADDGGAPRLFYCDVDESPGGRCGVLVGAADASGAGGASVATVCLAVDDCEGALRRARAAGGTLIGGPSDIALGGRVAAVIDPQGAAFFCWQPPAVARTSVPRSRSRSDLVAPSRAIGVRASRATGR